MSGNIITKNDETKVKVKNEVEFDFKGLKLPAMVDENDGFWFTSTKVQEFMQVKNIRQNTDRLDNDEKGVCKVYTLGGIQSVSVISESGLYFLTQRSNKKELKDFQRWVRKDVLPSIRKYGIAILEEKLEQLEPKDLAEVIKSIDPNVRVEYFEDLEESGACIKDCTKPLGYKSVSSITYKVPSKYIKEKNGLKFILSSGLEIRVLSSRKSEAAEIAKMANIKGKNIPDEAVVKGDVKAFFTEFEIDDEFVFKFEGENNRIDLVFTDYDIAFEVDEPTHDHYDKERDKRRSSFIKNDLGFDLIRCDLKFEGSGDAIRKLYLALKSKGVSF